MCGRFTLIRLSDFTDLFPWILPPELRAPPRYNIAPSQPAAVVANQPQPRVEFYRWGLIPSWAADPAIGNRMINARAESLAQKPSFRTALRRRRCLVPADGFFEWRKDPGGAKTPMYVRLRSGRPFAFAGLWDEWHDPDGAPLRTFTIVTTEANDLLRPIHNRMPVILREEDFRAWLDPGEREPPQLLELLRPYPADAMCAHMVSRAVNNPAHDSPDCIELAAPPTPPRRPAADPGLFGDG